MRRSLQLVLLVVAMVYPALAAWEYFVVLAGRPATSWAWGAAKLLQATLPLFGWLVLGIDRRRSERPGVDRARALRAGLTSGLALGGAILVAWWLLLRHAPAFAALHGEIARRLAPFHATTPATFSLLALGLSLGHSLFEEYYWRWFLYGALAPRLGRAAAMALASVAFAAHHFLIVRELLGGRRRSPQRSPSLRSSRAPAFSGAGSSIASGH